MTELKLWVLSEIYVLENMKITHLDFDEHFYEIMQQIFCEAWVE